MTHHTKPLLRMIERIQGHQRDYPASDTFAPVRAQYTPDQWQALGGDAHHCATLERMNATQIQRDRAVTRRALVVVCVAFGMALAAVALSHGYGRALDAVASPHLEGF